MKYSLRSLMIVVTLTCVLLGAFNGRIYYLHQNVAYHERKCAEAVGRLAVLTGYRKDEVSLLLELIAENEHDYLVKDSTAFFVTWDFNVAKRSSDRGKFIREWKEAYNHHRLAAVYRVAVNKPLSIVDDSIVP